MVSLKSLLEKTDRISTVDVDQKKRDLAVAKINKKIRVLDLEDTDKDEPGTQGDMKKYQAARSKVLNKYGVKSCSELEGDEKKACYAALDAAHVSDDEEEKGEKKEEVKTTFSKMFTHVKSLMQGK